MTNWTGDLYVRSFEVDRVFHVRRKIFQWKISAKIWNWYSKGFYSRMLFMPKIRPTEEGDEETNDLRELSHEEYWREIE